MEIGRFDDHFEEATRSGSCEYFLFPPRIRAHICDKDLALAAEKDSKAQGWTFAASGNPTRCCRAIEKTPPPLLIKSFLLELSTLT